MASFSKIWSGRKGVPARSTVGRAPRITAQSRAPPTTTPARHPTITYPAPPTNDTYQTPNRAPFLSPAFIRGIAWNWRLCRHTIAPDNRVRSNDDLFSVLAKCPYYQPVGNYNFDF